MHALAVTVEQAAEMLGVKKTTLYQLLGRNELRGRKIGRRIVIEMKLLEEFLSRQPPARISLPARDRRRLAAQAADARHAP